MQEAAEYVLETERLKLRKCVSTDTDFIITLVNTPGWIQYIGDRNIHTQSDALNYLVKGPFLSYEQYGYGVSIVETKDEKIPIGVCGLLKRDYLNHPDIGYAYLPAYMGKGYALEMANAVVSYSQSVFSIKEIQAITLEENIRSIHLLEKIGMQYMKQITLPDTTTPLLLYGLQLP